MLLLLLALPAQAHTRGELDAWVDSWALQADAAFSSRLVAEYKGMATRHPWYFYPQPGPTQAPAAGHRATAPGVQQWRPLVAQFFAAQLVDTALCVMAGESKGDPWADNPTSTAAGLFQFLRSTWDTVVPLAVTGGSYASGQVYDPVANVRAAAWLQAAAGWGQWNAYSGCR